MQNKMRLSIIVAVADNHVIGKENKLIWHLPADLKRLKALTMGHHLIMGRKTFESLGKPLPGRPHIVISRNPDLKIEGVTVVPDLDRAISLASSDEEAFIFGGAEIYKQSMNLASRIYLTRVHSYFDGDAFFPEIDLKLWRLTDKEDFQPDDRNKYTYSFEQYDRIYSE